MKYPWPVTLPPGYIHCSPLLWNSPQPARIILAPHLVRKNLCFAHQKPPFTIPKQLYCATRYSQNVTDQNRDVRQELWLNFNSATACHSTSGVENSKCDIFKTAQTTQQDHRSVTQTKEKKEACEERSKYNFQQASPFEFELSHVPLPCAYVKLPWDPEKSYCRLLPLNKQLSTSPSSPLQDIHDLPEILNPYDLIVRRMFVERISHHPSCYLIRYISIPSIQFNHDRLLNDYKEISPTTQKLLENEECLSANLFQMSQKMFQANQIFGFDCMTSNACFSYASSDFPCTSTDVIHSIFLIYLRLQLNQLPLSRAQLEREWYPKLCGVHSHVKSLVIVLDFRFSHSNTNDQPTWSPESMRRIVHLTAQIHSLLDSCFIHTLRARNLCIIHLPPLCFNNFLDECVEKVHKQLNLACHLPVSITPIQDSSHHITHSYLEHQNKYSFHDLATIQRPSSTHDDHGFRIKKMERQQQVFVEWKPSLHSAGYNTSGQGRNWIRHKQLLISKMPCVVSSDDRPTDINQKVRTFKCARKKLIFNTKQGQPHRRRTCVKRANPSQCKTNIHLPLIPYRKNEEELWNFYSQESSFSNRLNRESFRTATSEPPTPMSKCFSDISNPEETLYIPKRSNTMRYTLTRGVLCSCCGPSFSKAS